MAVAMAGMLGLPVSGYARAAQDPQPQPQQQPKLQPQPDQPQPQPAQPQPTQPQPTPQPEQPQPQQPQPQQPTPTPQPTNPEPTTPQPSAATSQSPDQSVSPQEHLRQAQEAVNGISATALPARNRASLAQLKRHLATLEKSGSGMPAESPSAASKSARSSANWGTEVAAIDKIITEMVGSDTAASTTGSTSPSPTGTSGSKSSATMIDDATRAKLMEVRTHITAYAAGMSGSPSTPRSEASMTPEPSSPAAGAQSTAPSNAAPPTTTPEQSSPAQSSPAQSSPQSTTPPSTAAGEAAQNPAAAQSPQPQVDAEAAHRHLVAARDALSQMTQLPAAAQLSGDARTQVSQLITNFNELINAQTNWRESYQKVAANMNTLIGPDNSDAEAKGGAPTTQTGATPAPGAVGTTGTTTIDPTLRAKLVEVRTHLTEFEKASGGSAK